MNTGLKHIEVAFAKPGAAYMPYLTLGYPDFDMSLALVEACAGAAADLMELGLPFSDPLADGPTVQHSTQVALEQGMTVRGALDGVRTLRGRGVQVPFMLMGYYNPILAYGVEAFVRDAAEAGADGFIVPDLPPEEAGEIRMWVEKYGLGISFMLSPNSPEHRIRKALSASSGFAYLVSVLGITGARQSLPPDLETFIHRVREASETGIPLAVGFGISTPEQATAVGGSADGVIVGSALIRAIDEAMRAGRDPVGTAAEFTKKMVAAL